MEYVNRLLVLAGMLSLTACGNGSETESKQSSIQIRQNPTGASTLGCHQTPGYRQLPGSPVRTVGQPLSKNTLDPRIPSTRDSSFDFGHVTRDQYSVECGTDLRNGPAMWAE